MPGYHMRRKDKEIEDAAEISGILKRGKFASLALCRDGEPYIVTLNYGLDETGRCLFFHCAAEGLKIEFMRSRAYACGTVVEDLGYKQGQCSHAYRSAVFRGPVEIISKLEEKKRALSILIRHLEDNPEPMIEKIMKDEKAIGTVGIVKLVIDEITAKSGS